MTPASRGIVRDLFGVPVSALAMPQVIELVAETIANRRRLRIGVVNAAKLVNMRRDERLRNDVLSSDLILADGMAVVWASRLLGQPVPQRVAGIDLMHQMLDLGMRRGYRVYCLGADSDVLSKTLIAFQRQYDGVHFVGSHHGYFSPDEESSVAAQIAAANPDILLVAMSSPRKEEFLASWGDRLGVPICHGVGGSFDVVAGKVHRAPVIWQRLGFEWLYRVVQEPRRLWRRYLITNMLFIEMVLIDLTRRLSRRLTLSRHG